MRNFQPKGLTVIVGPNSAGKSQFLQDLNQLIRGQQRDLVVCDDVEIRKPGKLDPFIDALIQQGYVEARKEADGRTLLVSRTPQFGIGGACGNIHLEDAERQFKDFVPDALKAIDPSIISRTQFEQYFGPMLCTALFLHNRLLATNEVGNFDWETGTPSADVQALHLNAEAQVELESEVKRVFGKWLWVDFSRANVLTLRVSETEPPVDRHRPGISKHFRKIETEGDGFKSFVAICMALLLGRRPVCLIDEPEMCLHPPQAAEIGRIIGTHATSKVNSIIVATHSSHVLRGIVQAASNLRIIRLTKNLKGFLAHQVSPETLQVLLGRPMIRAEGILDGIFADAVTIVESEHDRAVYQAALQASKMSRRRDVQFIPVGGTGGIAEAISFYRSLKIPVAAIADLDLVLDVPKIERLLGLLASKPEKQDLLLKVRRVKELVRLLPPTISEKDAKKNLKNLYEGFIGWTDAGDEKLVRGLRNLASTVDRSRRLKAEGIEGFKQYSEIYEGLKEIVKRLAAVGLFLVPVGELENWESELTASGPNPGRKPEWANEAARRILATPDKAPAITSFILEVVGYQNREAQRIWDTAKNRRLKKIPKSITLAPTKVPRLSRATSPQFRLGRRSFRPLVRQM